MLSPVVQAQGGYVRAQVSGRLWNTKGVLRHTLSKCSALWCKHKSRICQRAQASGWPRSTKAKVQAHKKDVPGGTALRRYSTGTALGSPKMDGRSNGCFEKHFYTLQAHIRCGSIRLCLIADPQGETRRQPDIWRAYL
eukprot:scaffold149621_cov23-Tisochrysis_lutea.AAC.1